jgi:large repetitive protein
VTGLDPTTEYDVSTVIASSDGQGGTTTSAVSRLPATTLPSQLRVTALAGDGDVTLTVDGLTNGTSYAVLVRGLNGSDAGVPSAPVTVTPTPRGDTSASYTYASSQEGTVHYLLVPRGAPAPTAEQIRAGEPYGDVTPVDAGSMVVPDGGSITIAPDGLDPTAGYDLSVVTSSPGESDAVSYSPVIVAQLTTRASAPEVTGLVGDGAVTLTVDGLDGQDGSNFAYSLDGGSTWIDRSPAATTSPFTVEGLANGTEYTVLVRGMNGTDPGLASEPIVLTPRVLTVPTAPTLLTAQPLNGSARLELTPPMDDGGRPILNYEYSTDGGLTWTAMDPASPATTLIVPGLRNGTTYAIQVRAVTTIGAGDASEPSASGPSRHRSPTRSSPNHCREARSSVRAAARQRHRTPRRLASATCPSTSRSPRRVCSGTRTGRPSPTVLASRSARAPSR